MPTALVTRKPHSVNRKTATGLESPRRASQNEKVRSRILPSCLAVYAPQASHSGHRTLLGGDQRLALLQGYLAAPPPGRAPRFHHRSLRRSTDWEQESRRSELEHP